MIDETSHVEELNRIRYQGRPSTQELALLGRMIRETLDLGRGAAFDLPGNVKGRTVVISPPGAYSTTLISPMSKEEQTVVSLVGYRSFFFDFDVHRALAAEVIAALADCPYGAGIDLANVLMAITSSRG